MASVTPTSKKVAPPRSNATNAYDLLRDVCKVILEEPRRYYQNRWYVTNTERIESILGAKKSPDCGTMACRAGWIVQLVDGQLPKVDFETSDRACSLLGVKDEDYSSRFRLDVTRLFSRWDRDHDVGTQAYAKQGVSGLRKLMAKYKDRLKATPLPRRERMGRHR